MNTALEASKMLEHYLLDGDNELRSVLTDTLLGMKRADVYALFDSYAEWARTWEVGDPHPERHARFVAAVIHYYLSDPGNAQGLPSRLAWWCRDAVVTDKKEAMNDGGRALEVYLQDLRGLFRKQATNRRMVPALGTYDKILAATIQEVLVETLLHYGTFEDGIAYSRAPLLVTTTTSNGGSNESSATAWLTTATSGLAVTAAHKWDYRNGSIYDQEHVVGREAVKKLLAGGDRKEWDAKDVVRSWLRWNGWIYNGLDWVARDAQSGQFFGR